MDKKERTSKTAKKALITVVRAIIATFILAILFFAVSKSGLLAIFNNGNIETFPVEKSAGSNKQAIALIKETVFLESDSLEKWTQQLRVSCTGHFSATDKKVLGKIAKSFNSVKGFPGMKIVETKPNVTVIFIKKNEFAKFAKKYGKNPNKPVSFCYHLSRADRIYEGKIVIVQKWPQSFQNSEVLHEFFHLIGFYNHISQRDSILNKVAPVASLSANDLRAFKMLYDPRVEPGCDYAKLNHLF